MWFAGYATIVEAEFHRRRNAVADAAEAYERAVQWFDRFIEARPESRATADHYVGMAFGGRARMALEAGDLDASLEWISKSFERAPDAAASLDGLNLSTVDTAKMLRQRLVDAGDREAELARLEALLEALDPKMLELPAYEAPPPGERIRRR